MSAAASAPRRDEVMDGSPCRDRESESGNQPRRGGARDPRGRTLEVRRSCGRSALRTLATARGATRSRMRPPGRGPCRSRAVAAHECSRDFREPSRANDRARRAVLKADDPLRVSAAAAAWTAPLDGQQQGLQDEAHRPSPPRWRRASSPVPKVLRRHGRDTGLSGFGVNRAKGHWSTRPAPERKSRHFSPPDALTVKGPLTRAALASRQYCLVLWFFRVV